MMRSCRYSAGGSVGIKNWNILREGIAGIMQVDEEYICRALRLFSRQGLRVEPTGCLPLGALLQHQAEYQHKTVVAVISGGNVDEAVFQRLLS